MPRAITPAPTCALPTCGAARRRYIDGVAIGRGQCVVDDDGLIVPVSKCSMKELRAEAAARGAANAADMKRPELSAAIKVSGGEACRVHMHADALA